MSTDIVGLNQLLSLITEFALLISDFLDFLALDVDGLSQISLVEGQSTDPFFILDLVNFANGVDSLNSILELLIIPDLFPQRIGLVDHVLFVLLEILVFIIIWNSHIVERGLESLDFLLLKPNAVGDLVQVADQVSILTA